MLIANLGNITHEFPHQSPLTVLVSALDKLPLVTESSRNLILTFKAFNTNKRGPSLFQRHLLNLQAKAWCEAVVQRTPELVDPTNPPEASASLSAVNTAFGRKFNIVSFRWLSSNEI